MFYCSVSSLTTRSIKLSEILRCWGVDVNFFVQEFLAAKNIKFKWLYKQNAFG